MADNELVKIPTINQSLPHGVINDNTDKINSFIKLFPTLTDEDANSFLRIVGASGLEKQTPENVRADLELETRYANIALNNIDSKIDYIIDSSYSADGSSYWQEYKSGLIVNGGIVTIPASSIWATGGGSPGSSITIHTSTGSVAVTLVKPLTKYGLSVSPMGNFTDLSHIILYNGATSAITCRWEAKGR